MIFRQAGQVRAFRISPGNTDYFACLLDPADGAKFNMIVEVFAPGGATPPNSDAGAQEVFYVLRGRGTARVGDATRDRAGRLLYAAAGHRARYGQPRPRYEVCDDRGRRRFILLTEGQTSDHKGAAFMCEPMPQAPVLLGDRSYDADWFRHELAARDTVAVERHRRSTPSRNSTSTCSR